MGKEEIIDNQSELPPELHICQLMDEFGLVVDYAQFFSARKYKVCTFD